MSQQWGVWSMCGWVLLPGGKAGPWTGTEDEARTKAEKCAEQAGPWLYEARPMPAGATAR